LLIIIFPLSSIAMTKKEARAMIDNGNELFHQERYIAALLVYVKALRASEDLNFQNGYLSCICNIGHIYGMMKDYERATFYYEQGYAACPENNIYIRKHLLVGLVQVYCLTGDIKNGQKYYDIQLKTRSADEKGIRFFDLSNAGLIASTKKKYDDAISIYNKAVVFARKKNIDKIYEPDLYGDIADVYIKAGKPDSAILYLKKSCSESLKYGYGATLADGYKLMATAYKAKGDIKNLDKYEILYQTLSDSVYNQAEFNHAKNELLKFYEEDKAKSMRNLNVTINHQSDFIVIAVILISILVIASYVIFRRKRRLQRLYDELNERINNKADDDSLTLNAAAEESEVPADAKLGGMSCEQANALLKKIKAVMADPNNFSDPDFNRERLVQLVDSNTKYVSAIINSVYGKPFKTLLNELRIKEACKKLNDVKNYGNKTILSVAIDSGYNSSTSFIISFKKVVGMTPYVYQRLAINKSKNEK
jgi:AraC-like DNA-binding protein